MKVLLNSSSMCVHVCIHMCPGKHVYVDAYVCGSQRSMSGLSGSSPSFETECLSEPALVWLD